MEPADVIKPAFEWAFRLIAPLRLVNDQICEQKDPPTVFAARTWLFPISLLLFVNIAAIIFSNLNVSENKTVVTAIVFTKTAEMIVSPILIWLMLRVLRCPARFDVVIVAYTPFVLYAPIFETLAVSHIVGQYHIVKYLVDNASDLPGALVLALRKLRELTALMPHDLPIVTPIIAFCSEIGSLLLTVLTCEAIAYHTRNDRFRTYLAVCLAIELATIPQQTFHFAQLALTSKIAGLPTR